MQDVKAKLRRTVRANDHPAVAMWLVGNEINLEENRFVCDVEGWCKFWDDTVRAYQVANELCRVVEEEGYLCTSPLADVPMPSKYKAPGRASFEEHVRLLDSICTHFHLWMVNIYRGKTFGTLFSEYRKASGKPLLVGEYGIDAFDAWEQREDQVAHMEYTLQLVQELERNSRACVAGGDCAASGDDLVASGGMLMSWIDEYWKDVSWGPDSGRDCNDYNRNAEEQSPCGAPMPHVFPDHIMNEEWWGMVSTAKPCERTPSAPDRVSPRLAFLRLALLWRHGGCVPLDATGADGLPLARFNYNISTYPGCGASMRSLRCTSPECRFVSDCDLMAGVHERFPTVCPLPPPHMRNVTLSVEDERSQFPFVQCEPLQFKGLNLSAYPKLAQNRLQPHGLALYLDGKPFLVRGVCYSPTPTGHDPGYGEPWGDYFTTDWYKIFMRDIKLFVEMGANTIRLYTFKTSMRHGQFLDAADAAGLIVFGAFEIGTAEHTSLATAQDREKVKDRLRRQIVFSAHPVLTLWFVGNEMNGAWQGFVCEDSYAIRYLDFAPGKCQFEDNAVALMTVVDELCSVVHEQGMLCTTPLAGVSVPAKYACFPNDWPGCVPYGPFGWVALMDHAMVHMDVWSANLYPGRDFREFNFSRHTLYSTKPFFVSEYGIDAYNINAPKCDALTESEAEMGVPCNNDPNPNMIGVEDETSQADWVMSLIEGIEKNAVTCVEGCESRSVAGGSIMAWVDEWWKGRVIDAVDSDERNTLLGPLCPDKWAELQSPCGYPTPYGDTQPDRFVNEEWFGLFRVGKACANDVDLIVPRESWFRIKALWKWGGCIVHDTRYNVSHDPIYNTSWYPQCGSAVSQLRDSYYANMSAYRPGGDRSFGRWGNYPFDCTLMQAVHEASPLVCPPMPLHMQNMSHEIAVQRANWTDTVSECEVAADGVSLGMPLLFLLGGLTLYSKSKHKLLRVYHLYLRRPVMRLLRRTGHDRWLMSCIGRLVVSLIISGACAAVGALVGEVVRLFMQDLGDAVVQIGPLILKASYVDLGGMFGGGLGFSLSVLGMLCRDVTVRVLRWREARKLRKLMKRMEAFGSRHAGGRAGLHMRARGSTRTSRGKGGGGGGGASSSGRGLLGSFLDGSALNEEVYLLHPSVTRVDRQSQRMVVSPHDLHKHVFPIANHMTRIFGFQQRQPKKGVGGGDVLSSSACQASHVCHLLVHRVQRLRHDGLEAALAGAIRDLHAHVFGNYEHWRKHMGLPLPDAEMRDTVRKMDPDVWRRMRGGAEEYRDAQAWLSNLLLHELTLFYLIYGEAANVRLLPEALCFIFHCARRRLRFERRNKEGMSYGRGNYGIQDVHMQVGAVYEKHESFLMTVIEPLYRILRAEIKGRASEAIEQRVMYDDVNEAFWMQSTIRRVLSIAAESRRRNNMLADAIAQGKTRDSYDALRDQLAKQATWAETNRLPSDGTRLFVKTYTENVSFGHVLFTFHRVAVLHVVAVHVMVAMAFSGGWDWKAVSTSACSNAAIMLFRQLWGATHTKERSSMRNAHRRRLLVSILFWVQLLCHIAMPGLLLAQTIVPALASPPLSALKILGLNTLSPYELLAPVYLLFNLPAFLRLTPSFTELLLGEPLLGSGRQLMPPWRTVVVYVAFWMVTLGFKLLFNYYMLIVPLVEPTTKLWEVDLYCWHYNKLYSSCELDVVDLFVSDNNMALPIDHRSFGGASGYVHVVRWLRMRWYNLALITLRWLTPCVIMTADTILMYTMTSAVASGVLAQWYRIAEVTEWSDMVRRVEDSVRLLNTRMLASHRLLDEEELFLPGELHSHGIQGPVGGEAQAMRASADGGGAGGADGAHGASHLGEKDVGGALAALGLGDGDDDEEEEEEEEAPMPVRRREDDVGGGSGEGMVAEAWEISVDDAPPEDEDGADADDDRSSGGPSKAKPVRRVESRRRAEASPPPSPPEEGEGSTHGGRLHPSQVPNAAGTMASHHGHTKLEARLQEPARKALPFAAPLPPRLQDERLISRRLRSMSRRMSTSRSASPPTSPPAPAPPLNLGGNDGGGGGPSSSSEHMQAHAQRLLPSQVPHADGSAQSHHGHTKLEASLKQPARKALPFAAPLPPLMSDKSLLSTRFRSRKEASRRGSVGDVFDADRHRHSEERKVLAQEQGAHLDHSLFEEVIEEDEDEEAVAEAGGSPNPRDGGGSSSTAAGAGAGGAASSRSGRSGSPKPSGGNGGSSGGAGGSPQQTPTQRRRAGSVFSSLASTPLPQPKPEKYEVLPGEWRQKPFSVEARSREWQSFACVWNEIVRDLRHGDFLSNSERKELLFYSLGGEQCERFFGVPEYVIFPTMLTGPVFHTTVLKGGFHDFPSFERTYEQLRDLLLYMGANLGMISQTQLPSVLKACNQIGERLARKMRHGWPDDADAPLKLRDAMVDLLVHLYGWQAQSAEAAKVIDAATVATARGFADVAAAVKAVDEAKAHSEANAAHALTLVVVLLRALGSALALAPAEAAELESLLDMDARFTRFDVRQTAKFTPDNIKLEDPDRVRRRESVKASKVHSQVAMMVGASRWAGAAKKSIAERKAEREASRPRAPPTLPPTFDLPHEQQETSGTPSDSSGSARRRAGEDGNDDETSEERASGASPTKAVPGRIASRTGGGAGGDGVSPDEMGGATHRRSCAEGDGDDDAAGATTAKSRPERVVKRGGRSMSVMGGQLSCRAPEGSSSAADEPEAVTERRSSYGGLGKIIPSRLLNRRGSSATGAGGAGGAGGERRQLIRAGTATRLELPDGGVEDAANDDDDDDDALAHAEVARPARVAQRAASGKVVPPRAGASGAAAPAQSSDTRAEVPSDDEEDDHAKVSRPARMIQRGATAGRSGRLGGGGGGGKPPGDEALPADDDDDDDDGALRKAARPGRAGQRARPCAVGPLGLGSSPPASPPSAAPPGESYGDDDEPPNSMPSRAMPQRVQGGRRGPPLSLGRLGGSTSGRPPIGGGGDDDEPQVSDRTSACFSAQSKARPGRSVARKGGSSGGKSRMLPEAGGNDDQGGEAEGDFDEDAPMKAVGPTRSLAPRDRQPVSPPTSPPMSLDMPSGLDDDYDDDDDLLAASRRSMITNRAPPSRPVRVLVGRQARSPEMPTSLPPSPAPPPDFAMPLETTPRVSEDPADLDVDDLTSSSDVHRRRSAIMFGATSAAKSAPRRLPPKQRTMPNVNEPAASSGSQPPRLGASPHAASAPVVGSSSADSDRSSLLGAPKAKPARVHQHASERRLPPREPPSLMDSLQEALAPAQEAMAQAFATAGAPAHAPAPAVPPPVEVDGSASSDGGAATSAATHSPPAPTFVPPTYSLPPMKVSGGIASALGLESTETTLECDMEKHLREDHAKFSEMQRQGKGFHKNPLLRLLTMVRLEALTRPVSVQETTRRLAATRVKLVLAVLFRSLRTGNPSGEPINEQARRQIIYFCNSLHHRHLTRPPSMCNMRSFCALTPHYKEDVTYSMEALQVAGDDNASLLEIIKSLCPDEWANLCERSEGLEKNKHMERLRLAIKPTLGHKNGGGGGGGGGGGSAHGARVPHARRDADKAFRLYEDAVSDMRETALGRAPAGAEGADGQGDVPRFDMLVQNWCSDRSQLLARTVRGLMRDVHAFKVLALLEGVPRDHIDDLVARKFTYLVTCQVFDDLKNSSKEDEKWTASAIEVLQRRYPRNLRIAYVEQDKSRGTCASVVMGAEPHISAPPGSDAGDVRQLYKVRLPGDPILGEGKPENQNHAIIFAHGEYLQTLDMNQDNYMGEAFKMRNLLEMFVGNVRIVGFREHIISADSGLVASFAASNEFVFGTMIQRFMAWPLMVRLHYGHPDMWDKVWASTAGGVSKASKTIHVSEDIFGGANAVMRGGSIIYTEAVHCGKARDITFAGINQFEQKISGGNALQCMSRDYSRMGANLDIFRLLSLYTTSIGFFLTASLLHTALIGMLLSLISLAMCRAETFFKEGDVSFEVERGSIGMDHVYSAEFVLQLGFVKAVPLFIELWVETGFFNALKGLAWDIVSLKQIFTLFTERTRDYFFDQGVLYGSASYIATGRSFASLTSNFVHLYHLYARSHFYFAIKISALAFLYAMTTDLPKYYGMATWGLWLLALSILFAPWIFNPQSFKFSALQAHFHEFLMWLDGDPGVDKGFGSWRVWHEHTLDYARKQPIRQRLFTFALRQAWLIVLFTMCMAGLEEMPNETAADDPMAHASGGGGGSGSSGGGRRQLQSASAAVSALATPIGLADPLAAVNVRIRMPFSRAYLLVGNGVIFIVLAMLYYTLIGSRLNLVQVIFPSSKLGAFALSWAMRGLFSVAHLVFMRWLTSEHLSQEGAGWNTPGIPAGTRNLILLFAAGGIMLSIFIQLLATLVSHIPPESSRSVAPRHHHGKRLHTRRGREADLERKEREKEEAREAKEKKKRTKVALERIRAKMQEHAILDFWDRELDVLVGTIIWLVLTCVSLLPVGQAHSKLLFNRAYALAIGRLNRQNELIRGLFASSLKSWIAFVLLSVTKVLKAVASLVWGVFFGRAGLTRLNGGGDEEGGGGSGGLMSSEATFHTTEAGLTHDVVARGSVKRVRLPVLYNGRASWEEAIGADFDVEVRPSGFVEGGDGGEEVRSTGRRSSTVRRNAHVQVHAPLSKQDRRLRYFRRLPIQQRWAHLRSVVYPIAAQLCNLFGFQHERIHLGKVVPSNLDNQVDHLCKLVLNIMDRQGYDSFTESLYHAVSSLHRHLLRNYGRWLRHVGLASDAKSTDAKNKHSSYGVLSQNRTWACLGPFEFLTVEEEQDWVCTSQLHQLLLYLLIYGEAANLRFLPEALCFLFFCASNALTLEPTTDDSHLHGSEDDDGSPTRNTGAPAASTSKGFAATHSQQMRAEQAQIVYELRPVDTGSGSTSMPYVQDDFFDSIVCPLFTLLEQARTRSRSRSPLALSLPLSLPLPLPGARAPASFLPRHILPLRPLGTLPLGLTDPSPPPPPRSLSLASS